jgi:membrane-bound lytic murein transglycosylase D
MAAPAPVPDTRVGPVASRPAAGSTPMPVSSVPQKPAPRADTARATGARDSTPPPVTTAAIVQEVVKVFGDSAIPPIPPTVAPPGAVWDIDVHSYETHARVAHFVEVFTGRARAPFEKSMQRQSRYGALIRQKLRAGGLPEDMTYLALIESWYDPNAYSKAAAVGMWQFMSGTARGVGLRVDWWVDERRDPVRSTEGAVRMLKGLRSAFGSLYLAAAAYDGGDGRVSRGLTRYARALHGVEGDDRFFALADTKYLRPETRDYVPKLIAAALVGKEPARYGLTVDSMAPWAFDSVRVPGGTPLAAIAEAAGTDAAAIRDLNPHLLRGMTPPGERLWIRIPPGSGEGFADHYAALDTASRTAVSRVQSRKGESMASIAHKHALTVKQLAWYNPKVVRLKSGNLSAGQVILIPARATLAAATDVPNPSIEKYPRRSRAVKKKHPIGAATKGSVASR